MKNFTHSNREFLKQMYPNCNFEISYNFFYDETNNVRKYHNEGGKLNYKGDGNFILGGIVFHKEPIFDSLFNSLGLQKSITEVKFKHIAKGDFFQVLKSDKLEKILSFMDSNDVYIHYHSTNLLYFSIVDIIDSGILGSGKSYSADEIHELKSVLYDALSINIDKTMEFFHHFNYPNLKKEDFRKFVYHIKKNIKCIKIHQCGIAEINKVLDNAVLKGDLPFLINENPNVFIESFFPFYYHPVSIFNNSKHSFDNEELIKTAFSEFKAISSDIQSENYVFLDSKDSRLIQLSDVIVGLIGKLYQYINTIKQESVQSDFESLCQKQQNTYLLFVSVINKSLNKNPAFINNTMSITQHLIFKTILEMK